MPAGLLLLTEKQLKLRTADELTELELKKGPGPVALVASPFNFLLSLCTLSNQMTLCFELLMQIPL